MHGCVAHGKSAKKVVVYHLGKGGGMRVVAESPAVSPTLAGCKYRQVPNDLLPTAIISRLARPVYLRNKCLFSFYPPLSFTESSRVLKEHTSRSKMPLAEQQRVARLEYNTFI